MGQRHCRRFIPQFCSETNNSAGLYSHTKLGDPDVDDFSCADSCYLNSTHELTSEEGGDDEIVSMTTTDPDAGIMALYMLNR